MTKPKILPSPLLSLEMLKEIAEASSAILTGKISAAWKLASFL